jgi:hypothetical protein
MQTREQILRAYGVPDFEGAEAEGRQIRICCTTGRLAYLHRNEATRLAAELLVAGYLADSDEIKQALAFNQAPRNKPTFGTQP